MWRRRGLYENHAFKFAIRLPAEEGSNGPQGSSGSVASAHQIDQHPKAEVDSMNSVQIDAPYSNQSVRCSWCPDFVGLGHQKSGSTVISAALWGLYEFILKPLAVQSTSNNSVDIISSQDDKRVVGGPGCRSNGGGAAVLEPANQEIVELDSTQGSKNHAARKRSLQNKRQPLRRANERKFRNSLSDTAIDPSMVEASLHVNESGNLQNDGGQGRTSEKVCLHAKQKKDLIVLVDEYILAGASWVLEGLAVDRALREEQRAAVQKRKSSAVDDFHTPRSSDSSAGKVAEIGNTSGKEGETVSCWEKSTNSAPEFVASSSMKFLYCKVMQLLLQEVANNHRWRESRGQGWKRAITVPEMWKGVF